MAQWPQKPPIGTLPAYGSPVSRFLLRYLLLNEGAGTATVDLFGRKTGTTSTGCTLTRQGATFDATGGAVTLGDSNAMNFTGNFSIVASIFINSAATGEQCIVSRGLAGSWASQDTQFIVSSSGNLQLGTSFIGDSTSSAAITKGRWVTVAMVRAGTACTFYANGTAYAGTTLTQGTPNTSQIIRLGRKGDTGGYFNGSIGWLGYWTTALTADAIRLLTSEPFILFEDSDYPATDSPLRRRILTRVAA